MPPMPDLCAPRRGVRHRLDSAILSLLRLGVEAERIVVESAGPGWPAGTVVRQSPAPGSELSQQTRVVLGVAGAGGLDTLPFPLRDESDTEFRVDRLFALFDSQVQKLAHFVREAGEVLDLHPDDPPSALRWIEEIFRESAAPWPESRWYAVARLLPALHRVAGTAEGVTLGCGLVFDLPVERVRTVGGVVPLAPERRTRLGEANSRLGFDTVAGDGAEAQTVLEVTFGPLDLETYRRHHRPEARREREALYRLVLPYHLHGSVVERWSVGDPSAALRLGEAPAQPVLGVNSYLGADQPRRIA